MSEESQKSSTIHKPLSGLRLLIVDDSPDNQLLFSRFLVTAGAEVATACDGADGVSKCMETEQIGDKPFDAVIMDIRMPVMDGYEATRRLRSAGFPGPIIALTAHAVPGEESRCRQAGCSDFLTKPVDRSRLTRSVLTAFQAFADRPGQIGNA